jgi:hypothetical protein
MTDRDVGRPRRRKPWAAEEIAGGQLGARHPGFPRPTPLPLKEGCAVIMVRRGHDRSHSIGGGDAARDVGSSVGPRPPVARPGGRQELGAPPAPRPFCARPSMTSVTKVLTLVFLTFSSSWLWYVRAESRARGALLDTDNRATKAPQ